MPVSALPADNKQNTRLESLLESTACGERSAMALLYNETKASVYGFVLSILRNSHDAEDVMQETYVKIFSCAGDYDKRGKPMAWILTIAKNFALMKLREGKRRIDISDEDLERCFPDNGRIDNDDRMVLEQTFKTLNDEERQIVLLHAVSGFKHREIAEFLKLPLSTVLSKYNRAIAKLVNKMEGVMK